MTALYWPLAISVNVSSGFPLHAVINKRKQKDAMTISLRSVVSFQCVPQGLKSGNICGGYDAAGAVP